MTTNIAEEHRRTFCPGRIIGWLRALPRSLCSCQPPTPAGASRSSLRLPLVGSGPGEE